MSHIENNKNNNKGDTWSTKLGHVRLSVCHLVEEYLYGTIKTEVTVCLSYVKKSRALNDTALNEYYDDDDDLRTTWCHLPYGITQPSEHAPP